MIFWWFGAAAAVSAELAGSDRDWRIRFGQYRIVYEINDDQETLTIFTVAKRSDAYR